VRVLNDRDTIAAISTPYGTGAIAIVRISGPESLNVVSKSIRKGIKAERKLHRRDFLDNDGELIDEVLVSYFKAPRSYTGEDMVEIYCHGGVLVTNKTLDTLLSNGARLAVNGEFTRRAFLNGKMDLLKAEAILHVIEAKSESALKLALGNLKGKLSDEMELLRSKLIDVLSRIEVSIDYSDDVIISDKEILDGLTEINRFLSNKIKHADRGLHISTGVTMTIVGKPNVGKSTLLNKLLAEDRAIVTEIPGTTRDIIRGEVKIQGTHFIISDTAGIRRTEDKIEKIGIEKALKEAKKSDIILFVLDATTGFTDEDEYILSVIKSSNFIPVWNKRDVGINFLEIGEDVHISASTGWGLRGLEEVIIKKVGPLISDGELAHIISERQLEYLKRIHLYIKNSIDVLSQGYPVDIVSVDIRQALSELDELSGKNFTEDLLDNIFSNFCVGK